MCSQTGEVVTVLLDKYSPQLYVRKVGSNLEKRKIWGGILRLWRERQRLVMGQLAASCNAYLTSHPYLPHPENPPKKNISQESLAGSSLFALASGLYLMSSFTNCLVVKFYLSALFSRKCVLSCKCLSCH